MATNTQLENLTATVQQLKDSFQSFKAETEKELKAALNVVVDHQNRIESLEKQLQEKRK